MGNTWQTFWRLSAGEKWELIEAVFALARARLEIKLFTFKVLAAKLGVLTEFPLTAAPVLVSSQEKTKALRVKRAIQRTHSNVPWENVCLPQAVAAMRMLTRRNVPAHLYFGALVQKEQNKLQAHAWVRVGEEFVSGQRGHQKYAAVAMFSNHEKI